MKQLRSNIWIVLLGMLLMMSVISASQALGQTDQKKKTEAASCSMDSCCCHGGSCSMKKEGATATDAKEDCCCGGDSCDLKTNKSMENHAADNGCCCGSDSCDMVSKEKKENHGSSESCCCDMKMKHKDTEQTKS